MGRGATETKRSTAVCRRKEENSEEEHRGRLRGPRGKATLFEEIPEPSFHRSGLHVSRSPVSLLYSPCYVTDNIKSNRVGSFQTRETEKTSPKKQRKTVKKVSKERKAPARKYRNQTETFQGDIPSCADEKKDSNNQDDEVEKMAEEVEAAEDFPLNVTSSRPLPGSTMNLEDPPRDSHPSCSSRISEDRVNKNFVEQMSPLPHNSERDADLLFTPIHNQKMEEETALDVEEEGRTFNLQNQTRMEEATLDVEEDGRTFNLQNPTRMEETALDVEEDGTFNLQNPTSTPLINRTVFGFLDELNISNIHLESPQKSILMHEQPRERDSSFAYNTVMMTSSCSPGDSNLKLPREKVDAEADKENNDMSIEITHASMASRRNFSRMSHIGGVPFYLNDFVGVRSPKNELLWLCNRQKRPYSWFESFTERALDSCVKIGEGSYGEVFRATVDGNIMAIKIVPVEGDQIINGAKPKRYHEMMPEVIIGRELSNLGDIDIADNSAPNFIKLISTRLIYGRYPEQLLNAWQTYDEERGSENDCPDCFSDTQEFVVFQFIDGGQDLESVALMEKDEAKSIIAQVALSLIIAETAMRFEHRDLHIGNVLVKRLDSRDEELRYRLEGQEIKLRSNGVQVYIIDFTNSRIKKDNLIIYADLAEDEELFNGPADNYQYTIYRKMRKQNGNNWREYEPKTNLFWLNYLLRHLINVSKYKKRLMTLKQRAAVQPVLDNMLKYNSITELLQKSDDLLEWLGDLWDLSEVDFCAFDS